MSLTVACVWVRGNVPYSAEYVIRLKSMCRKAYPEHRFVCLTDMAAYLPTHVECIQIKKLEGFGWWSKLELWNPQHKVLQSGRIVYQDLDTLNVAKCDPIVDFHDGFCAVPHAGTFQGKGDKKVVKWCNSSVMSWNGGEHIDLYEDWSPAVTRRLWGDQDWIGERMTRNGKLMPLEWFPRLSDITHGNADHVVNVAKVILCKKPKNLEAAKLWSWFDKAWR